MTLDHSPDVDRTPTSPMTPHPPSEPRQIRTLPNRTTPHRPYHSAPLVLYRDEWRPTSLSNAPAPEVAEAQTLAEFSRLNLGTPSAQKSKTGQHGRAEETLISLAGHAPKRELEPGTPEERPTKKRRGLASTLVDGAVSVASSWWHSWGNDGNPADVAESRTSAATFVLDPAYAPSSSSSPSRATFPPRPVYLSNRRRRAMLSTPRRRAPPGRRSGYSTYLYANTVNAPQPPSTPPTPPTNTARIRSQDTSNDENVDSDDDAFARMQGRLDSMITQCRTALSSQPDLEELMHPTHDPTTFSRPSSLKGNPSTPLFLSSSSTTQPNTLAITTSPPPPQGSGQATLSNYQQRSRTARTPSRIPIPIRSGSNSPARPPTASTFAFRMRPSSHRVFDASGSSAPSSVSRPPSMTPPRLPRAGSSRASHRLNQLSSVPIFDTASHQAPPTPSLPSRRPQIRSRD